MLEDLKLRAPYDGMLYLAESARNPPTIRSHHHAELELNLVVRGSISYVVGGRRFSFGRRTLLWLFPAQDHQLVDRTPDAQNYVAVFKPRVVSQPRDGGPYEFLKRKRTGSDHVLHTPLPPEAFELVRRTMDELMVGAPDADILNREVGFGAGSAFRFEHRDPDGFNAGLRHLLLLCWRQQRLSNSQPHAVALHPTVSKALDLLTSGEVDLSLPELARRSGGSSAHLSRLFGRQVGVPLSRYRNSVRLSTFFARFRADRKAKLAELVYAAGFGSYAQFHRVFVQAYGRAPRDVLRSM